MINRIHEVAGQILEAMKEVGEIGYVPGMVGAYQAKGFEAMFTELDFTPMEMQAAISYLLRKRLVLFEKVTAATQSAEINAPGIGSEVLRSSFPLGYLVPNPNPPRKERKKKGRPTRRVTEEATLFEVPDEEVGVAADDVVDELELDEGDELSVEQVTLLIAQATATILAHREREEQLTEKLRAAEERLREKVDVTTDPRRFLNEALTLFRARATGGGPWQNIGPLNREQCQAFLYDSFGNISRNGAKQLVEWLVRVDLLLLCCETAGSTCADSHVKAPPGAVLAADLRGLGLHVEETVEDLRGHLAVRDRQLATKDGELAEAARRLAKKEEELAITAQRLADAEVAGARKDQELADRDRSLANLAEELAAAQEELATKEVAPPAQTAPKRVTLRGDLAGEVARLMGGAP